MRILMLHHDGHGPLGGASHMAWQTADALARRGHDVAVAGTLLPGADLSPRAATSCESRRKVRKAQRLGSDLPRSLAEAASRTGWVPDVVHVTDLVDPTAGRQALGWARAAEAVFAVTPATDPALWADAAAGREVARQADVVFALTPTEGRALEAAGVVPVRLAQLGQGPQLVGVPDPGGFRRRVGAHGPLVLFLGRKLPTKGYQHLIDATPAILDWHPDATIVVAGPDPTGAARRAVGAAGVLGLVDLGALDEVDKHSALAAADVLCLPSVADSFPLVFVEAWWCGTPVVSGPFPGASEVVREGVDGVVTTADARGVAVAVTGLLGDPARRTAMARAGRQRAEVELTWDAVAVDAERGYRQAAGPLSPSSCAARSREAHSQLTRSS